MPLGPGVQLATTCLEEFAVAVTLAGADGSASVVTGTVADIGERFPPASVS